MSQSVDRLKELLFDTEARALSDVQRRLSKSESDLLSHRRELAERLDEVFARAGTEERFRLSVASVLDRALRHAETERHAELSAAVAPLIVRTIRTEITNSRDELVDALYPITGRMVKAYVASAIADLAAQINRKVEGNPVMLRLRSLMSGRSVSELALADSNTLKVEEIYLIRRGTGELVGRWPLAEEHNRSQAMSGVLAAINEFASDAFGNDGSSLRRIDMGDACVYLRASPLYLLAARCTGAAPASAERLLDDALLSTIERCQTLTANAPVVGMQHPPPYQSQLGRLSDQLSLGFSGISASERRSSASPALVLLGLIALALAGMGAWIVLDRYFVHRAQDIAQAAIAATPGTKGYLVNIDVSSFGRRVALTGLMQDDSVKAALLQRLHHDLPSTEINDRLTPLPGVHGKIGPAIERASVTASLQRAALRLEQATADLPQMAAGAKDPAHRDLLNRAASLATKSARNLRDEASALYIKPRDQSKLSDQLRQLAAAIGAIAGGDAPPAAIEPASQSETAPESARRLELAADQLATIVAAAFQADAVRRNLPPPAPQVVRAADITAFERLSVFVRTHAVFFGDDLNYRRDEQAAKTLDDLAALMRETDALVRIVGYTDAKGSADRNTALSENRARKIFDALTTRGVAASRLVAVGRHDANQIASLIGETSPNRRVEFELGFDGESSQ
ncbi:MAG: OmpA family protein [Hyphomicrobiaceae bacterium]|nr:OmpA family protein [Hyphomicrobiaceae bacterium]